MNTARLFLGHLAAVAALVAAGTASAQPSTDNEAKALALFQEALAAKDRGDYATACPRFEAVMQLYPSASAQINVAQCLERDGKVASAWAAYKRALVLNKETKEQARREKLEQIAAAAASALEANLPKLRIVVASAPAGLRVEEDGQELPAATFGAPMPTDPGPHRIAATAPGYEGLSVTVTFEVGKVIDVPVDMKPVAAPVAAPPPGPPSVGPAPSKPSVPVWAWIAGGAGVAALGVAAGFGVDALMAQSKLVAACKPSLADCVGTPSMLKADASVADERDVGKDVFIVLGVAGVAGITAGVFGIVRAKAPQASAGSALLVVPYVTPAGGGLSAMGVF